jgi:hypothetical protein
VVRIQSAGSVVRVELARTDADGGPEDEANSSIHVELTHDRYRTLALTTGETVFVKARDARVFVAEERPQNLSGN